MRISLRDDEKSYISKRVQENITTGRKISERENLKRALRRRMKEQYNIPEQISYLLKSLNVTLKEDSFI